MRPFVLLFLAGCNPGPVPTAGEGEVEEELRRPGWRSATGRTIRARININSAELDSILRLVDSRLDARMRMLDSDAQ